MKEKIKMVKRGCYQNRHFKNDNKFFAIWTFCACHLPPLQKFDFRVNSLKKVSPDAPKSFARGVGVWKCDKSQFLESSNTVGHPFFSKKWNDLCILFRSLQTNGTIFAFFSILYKRTEWSLRSFPFLIKERNNLCVLFCSLKKNGTVWTKIETIS